MQKTIEELEVFLTKYFYGTERFPSIFFMYNDHRAGHDQAYDIF